MNMKTLIRIPLIAILATYLVFLLPGCSDDNSATPDPSEEGILFRETFDDQPDWHSGLEENATSGHPDGLPDRVQMEDTHTIPEGWYAVRQDPAFSPSMGHDNGRESIEILAENSDKALGGTGKSMVTWRDSNGPDWYWGSDCMLSKYFPEGYNKLYVKFWIRFSPDWTPEGSTGMTKLFRISSWDEDAGNIYKAFKDGPNGPIVIWDYLTDSYGARNKLALRGHPTSDNYQMTNPEPINLPRKFGNGSASLNFDKNIRDLDGDGTEDNEVNSLFNLETGEVVSGIVSHDELWGNAWHKMEFYVKMNSAPGAYDGVLKQWMDDQLIFSNTEIPWMGHSSDGNVKWNVVTFGGNSHFHAYDEGEKRQEWRAIDDIEIRDSLPEDKSQ